MSVGGGQQGGSAGSVGLSGAGIGKDQGSASSTTTAGVSGLAGNAAVRTGDAPTGIARIFDADKVQKEVAAQVQITQAFSQQAPVAIKDFTSKKTAEIKLLIDKESDPLKKAELEQEAKNWSSTGRYSAAMNVIVAALSAGATGVVGAVSKESLALAADEMRQAMIEDSKKFPGICDAHGNCLDNKSGKSTGVNEDGFKLAGGRVNLELICGVDSARCEENKDGTIKFIAGDINKFLDENPNSRSPMGGWQGATGQLKPLGDYAPGSLADKLSEAYSGTHDTLNSGTWYGPDGNIKRGMSDAAKSAGELLNKANVVVATPFALATFLPPEVWNAILISLKAAR